MITVLRASDSVLRRHCGNLLADGGRSLELACPDRPGRSWHGVRSLIDQLRPEVGDDAIEAAIGRRRAAASLVLEGIEEGLSPQESAQRQRLAARIDSHLSHNWAIQRDLLDAGAAILADLLAQRDLTLVVPNLRFLDRETTAVLRSLYRQFADRAPDLVAGYEMDCEDPDLDPDGLLWTLLPNYTVETVMGWQLLPDTETIELAGGGAGGDSEGRDLPPRGRQLDQGDDLESRAFEALRAPAAVADTELCELVVEAMWAAFRNFGFTACLRLGLELLALGPNLERRQLADIHGLIGISAHNRQFKTQGNHRLSDFLERHFRAALEAETRPAERCAVLYRLAVTLGRRKGEVEEALRWADQGIAEAEAAALHPLRKAHLMAWARNIRSLILIRLKRKDDAIANGEAAWAIMRQARSKVAPQPSSVEDEWSREMAATHALLAANQSVLEAAVANAERSIQWQSMAYEIESNHDGTERYEAQNWISRYRWIHRADLAYDKAVQGLDSAWSERDGSSVYLYTVSAAELSYRLGRARRAYGWYEKAEALYRRFHEPFNLRPIVLNFAYSAGRAGLFEEARDLLQRARSRPRYRETSAQAQILAVGGVFEAQAGRRVEAERSMNRAIDLAVELDQRDTLMRVSAAAGTACQALGRTEQARESFAFCLEIAEKGRGQIAPLPAEILHASLGLHDCGAADRELALRALELVPWALRDPEAWWNVPRLLPLVTDIARTDPEALESEDLHRPLETLILVARQREDCRSESERLLEALSRQRVSADSVSPPPVAVGS